MVKVKDILNYTNPQGESYKYYNRPSFGLYCRTPTGKLLEQYGYEDNVVASFKDELGGLFIIKTARMFVAFAYLDSLFKTSIWDVQISRIDLNSALTKLANIDKNKVEIHDELLYKRVRRLALAEAIGV